MKSSLKTFFSISFSIFLTLPSTLNAQTVMATLDSAEGEVEIQPAGSQSFIPARTGQQLRERDSLHTGRNSRAAISFTDGGFLRLAENTLIQLEPRNSQGRKQISMPDGRAYYFSREPKSAPDFQTPSVTTSIFGTEFALAADSNGTTVSVLDGSIKAENSRGSALLKGGEFALVKNGEAPQKSILLKPLDAVQWALHYPAVLMPGDLEEAKDHPAFIAFKAGRFNDALAVLESQKSPLSPQLMILAASLFLQRGDAEKAGNKLAAFDREVSKESPAAQQRLKAVALSCRAVISLSMNEIREASRLSEEAYGLAPESPSVLFAYSTVAQARRDLDAALASARQLASVLPQNGYSKARVAELEMGFGRNDSAGDHAAAAVKNDPQNAYAKSVYAFNLLIRGETQKAVDAFEETISLQKDLAPAYLGLGLARIHQGFLEEGRQHIEKAAFLAPQVSVYRSYLGKAFFEEEREQLAGHEYDRAIALDPLDPTPYLYRAYNKLSANDPVGALDDVESSIERNENRAVYRSSLLLDEDSAVRSAGLAETFTALGFSQAARIEAIKSINQNYSNYSAHLLLSDSYESIMLNDASLSERRIADLLAPLSFNLFQHNAGSLTLNEYNTLFERPQDRTSLGTTLQSYDDLIEGNARHSARTEDAAYSMAVGSTLMEGSKSGNYRRLYSAGALGSYELTSNHRVLGGADVAYEQLRELNEEPDTERIEEVNTRLGFLHRFASYSKLLGEVSFSRLNNRFLSHNFQRYAVLDEIYEGESLERDYELLVDELSREYVGILSGRVQHIQDSEYVSLVSGFEGNAVNPDRGEDSYVLEDEDDILAPLGYAIRTRGDNQLRSTDTYLYSIFHLGPWADLTAGGTFTHVELEWQEIPPFLDATSRYDRLNPKVGITAYPTDSLTLRAAWFETLRKSSLESDMTLEPTLVSGINQRFTDYSGTQSTNIGGGADYRISRSSYLGVEGIHRHTRQPLFNADSLVIADYDNMTIDSDVLAEFAGDIFMDQDFITAYFSQVLTGRLVSTLQYDWSKVKTTDPEYLEDFRLNKVSLDVRYFDSSGFFPFMNARWRQQERAGQTLDEGTDAFWILDAGLGYRIPERHGSILLQVSNLLDKDFNYDQRYGLEPYVHSGIGVMLIGNVNF